MNRQRVETTAMAGTGYRQEKEGGADNLTGDWSGNR